MTKANEFRGLNLAPAEKRRSTFGRAFTPFFMQFCQGKLSRVELNQELRRIMKDLKMWNDPDYLEHRLAIEKVLGVAGDDGEGKVESLFGKEKKGRG